MAPVPLVAEGSVRAAADTAPRDTVRLAPDYIAESVACIAVEAVEAVGLAEAADTGVAVVGIAVAHTHADHAD